MDPRDEQAIDYRLAEPGSWEEAERLHAEELPEGKVEFARIILPPDGYWLPWPEAVRDAAGACGY